MGEEDRTGEERDKEREEKKIKKRRKEMKQRRKMKMKKIYEVPCIEVVSVSVLTRILTLSDGVLGTQVEHDAVENVFVKGSSSRSLWDLQW